MVLRIETKNVVNKIGDKRYTFKDDIKFDLNLYLQNKEEYKKEILEKIHQSNYDINFTVFANMGEGKMNIYGIFDCDFFEFIDFIYEVNFEKTIKFNIKVQEEGKVVYDYKIDDILNDEYLNYPIQGHWINMGSGRNNMCKIYWSEDKSELFEIPINNKNRLKFEDLVKYILVKKRENLRKKLEEIEKIL